MIRNQDNNLQIYSTVMQHLYNEYMQDGNVVCGIRLHAAFPHQITCRFFFFPTRPKLAIYIIKPLYLIVYRNYKFWGSFQLSL